MKAAQTYTRIRPFARINAGTQFLNLPSDCSWVRISMQRGSRWVRLQLTGERKSLRIRLMSFVV